MRLLVLIQLNILESYFLFIYCEGTPNVKYDVCILAFIYHITLCKHNDASFSVV